MRSLTIVPFFISQYGKQLKKKWFSLLLLFLFPFIVIGLLLTFITTVFIPSEQQPVRVALVDKDQTKETALFSKLLIDIGTENEAFQLLILSEEAAKQQIASNELSSYFVFPKDFTEHLYEGQSVTISVVGNEQRLIDTFIVKELLQSMTTYIGSAQANILTINEFAKQTSMSKEERMDLLYKQFLDFALYTLGKDQLVNETTIKNIATIAPVHYYIVAGWFMTMSIWVGGFFSLIKQSEHKNLKIRMQLFGVTAWQRLIARITVAFIGAILFTSILFGVIQFSIKFELLALDYLRLFIFVTLYCLTLLCSVAIIDQLLSSQKVQILVQCLFIMVVILWSGALIPTAYFSLDLQQMMPFVFSNEIMQWIVDIMLEGRNYASYTKAILMFCFTVVALFFVTAGKERWQQ